jgi:hypothetical protein
MKIEEILKEMPYLHHGEMNRKILDGSISLKTIKREYNILGSINDITVLIQKDNAVLIGISDKIESNNRILPLLKIYFKSKHILKFKNDFKNLIQVDQSVIMKQISNIGIMTNVYYLLADSGFTIVSDNTHFETAQGLWKNISKNPEYNVYVADIDNGIFKDKNESDIIYNGHNIPDYDIWTMGSNYDGSYRVLILEKNRPNT